MGDGDILTCSGVSAGIDMTLALITRLRGPDLARPAAPNMGYVWRQDPTDDPFA